MYREKLKPRKFRQWALGAIGAALGGIMLALIFPTVGRGVSAVDCTSESDPTAPECQMSTSVNTNMTTLVRSSIAVALSSRVELDVTPKAMGAFSVSGANLRVTTNNTTGYAVYMQTADNSSELKATNPHVNESIGPVEGVMSEGSYASNLNRWGYAVSGAGDSSDVASVSNMEYKAVPQAGDEAIVRTMGISREDDYDLSFAVAVGSDLPAGLYTNQILVSVIANPIEVRSLNDITYMQDMTAEICAITFEGESKELVDSRDGKSYKVAKLKDGNCWMVQNLALTAPAGGRELTPDDTDIKENWTLPETLVAGDWIGKDDQAVASVGSENNLGTYFTFYAATAQTIMEESMGIASGSVCPKGWKLPLSGESYNAVSGSFYNLLNGYGLATQARSVAGTYDIYLPDGSKTTNTVTANQYNISSQPLNLQLNGIVSSNGDIQYSDDSGALWSSVKRQQNSQGILAYALSFNIYGKTEPSYSDAWFTRAFFGKPVRCLAK